MLTSASDHVQLIGDATELTTGRAVYRHQRGQDPSISPGPRTAACAGQASGEHILNCSTANEIDHRIKEERAMEMRKLIPEQVTGEAERRSQIVRPGKASTFARTDNSWQQEAALFLLRSGFRPGDTTGQVQHVASPHRAGRTFGSVWHAMRSLLESEPGCSVGAAQDEDLSSSPQ